MIYTVTLNPAIDYVVTFDNIKIGEVNRISSENIFVGGKGINVSLVLNELETKSIALGFTAGFTGEYIKKFLEDRQISEKFIHVNSGFSRINVKIKLSEETEINGLGPKIDERYLNAFFEELDNISENDVLILAGSVPPSLPFDIYEKILERVQGKNIMTVVDASGKLLLNTLKYKPFLIKPNHHELGEIFEKELKSSDEIIFCAKKLKEMGAKNVLVSMGKDGAILIDENDETHICGACKGEVVNSVGAGDSMLAGFIAGYLKNGYPYALKLGTASGGATAFSSGLAKKETILKYLDK